MDMTCFESYLFNFHLQHTCFFIMSPTNKFMNQITVSGFLILTPEYHGEVRLSLHILGQVPLLSRHQPAQVPLLCLQVLSEKYDNLYRV